MCHHTVVTTCGHSGCCGAKVKQAHFQTETYQNQERHLNASGRGMVENGTAATSNDSLETQDLGLNLGCEATRGYTNTIENVLVKPLYS